MKNTHLDHPEDLILTGNLDAIRALYSEVHISMKMDGCPAIVWGHTEASFLYAPNLHLTRRRSNFATALMTSSHTLVIKNLSVRFFSIASSICPGQRMSIRVISLGLAELTCCILTPLCICLMRQSIRSW